MREVLGSGHVVVMLENDGSIYAATYAPGSDVSDDAIRDDFRRCGYGRKRGNFRPYNQSTGCYLSE